MTREAALKAWITKRTPMPERFWNRVEKRGPDECWPYHGDRGPYGHGKFHLNGKCIPSARMAWITTYGDPGEKWVLHTCDNGWCANLKHLYLGGPKQNSHDASERKRYPDRKGEKAANSVLTNEQAKQIKAQYIPSVVTQKMLAKQFGVSRSTIGWIVRGEHFVHV